MDEPPKTQASQWLLSRDGKKYGPMTSGQLKQLCKTGKISPADLICRAGSDRWTPAGEVPGLFVQLAQAPEAATEAPVRPIEEATGSVSNSADAYWKTLGSFFCIANLAACGVFGLIKSPPEAVRGAEHMQKTMKQVQSELNRLNEDLRTFKPRPVIEEGIKKGDIPNIPSVPRIPGIP
jgi:hypothetical protein